MSTRQGFVLLCLIGMLCLISYNLVRMPALALFAQSLGAGPETIGLVVSVSTLTGVLLKLPSGALSDVYGRPAVMRVGTLAFGLTPFLYPFVSDLDVLTGVRAVHGLATAVFAPSALATIAETYQSRRGAAIGTYTACTQTGALLGPVLGGWLLHQAGFPLTFITAGLFGCAGLALFVLFPLNRASCPAGGPGLDGMWRGFRLVAGNHRVLMTSVTDGAKMIANGALMAFLPIYGMTIGLNAGEIGLLFGVQGVTSLFSKPVMGRASDSMGRRPLILLGLVLCAVTFALIPATDELSMLLMLAAGFGLGEALVSAAAAALVADLSEAKTLGAGLGMQGTITDIGHAGGPLLAGVLIAQVSYAKAFAVIAALQVTAATLFWILVRTERMQRGSPSPRGSML